MNKNCRRFKMLALQTMAGDALEADVNDATSIFFWTFTMFCMCVSLYDGNKRCVEH